MAAPHEWMTVTPKRAIGNPPNNDHDHDHNEDHEDNGDDSPVGVLHRACPSLSLFFESIASRLLAIGVNSTRVVLMLPDKRVIWSDRKQHRDRCANSKEGDPLPSQCEVFRQWAITSRKLDERRSWAAPRLSTLVCPLQAENQYTLKFTRGETYRLVQVKREKEKRKPFKDFRRALTVVNCGETRIRGE